MNVFGGSKQKQSSSSKPVDLQAPQYVGIRGDVASGLQGAISGTGVTAPFNPATDTVGMSAPMTDQQTALMNQAVGSVQPGGNPLTDAATGMLTNTLNGQYLNPSSNPFLAATIQAAQRPVTEAFNQTSVPNLLSRFMTSGQVTGGAGSSAFANAADTANRDYMSQIADIGTNLAGANYTAERGNQMQAAGLANTLSNDQMTRMQSAIQDAALPQMVQNLGITNGLAAYNARINAILQALQTATAGTQPVSTAKQKSKGTSTTSPNIAGALLTPFGSGGAGTTAVKYGLGA